MPDPASLSENGGFVEAEVGGLTIDGQSVQLLVRTDSVEEWYGWSHACGSHAGGFLTLLDAIKDALQHVANRHGARW